jgi:hypothetical protein
MAAFCGIPTADQERKKNVPTGRLGGGKLTGREHSFRWGALKHYESSLPNVSPSDCAASGDEASGIG